MSLITSENQIVCFPSFVLTVFWCSTSYTVIIVLWKMLMEPVDAPTCWWPCTCLKCVSGLGRLEKTLSFLRCIYVIDLVLKYGSDINEGNLTQLLFYFIVLMGIVASVMGMSFFLAVFQVLDRSFLVLHFYGNVCNWFPKVFWPRMDWFWGFFYGKMAFFKDFISVWSEICKKCSIVILFWRHQFFSMFSLRGILVCALEMLVLFIHRIL